MNYQNRIEALEKLLQSNKPELRLAATAQAFVASYVNRASLNEQADDNDSKTLEPFTANIVAVCSEYTKASDAFEPVEAKDHPAKLSKPKQKAYFNLTYWNATPEDAPTLLKNSGAFFRYAKEVAKLAEHCEAVINNGAKIANLQSLAQAAKLLIKKEAEANKKEASKKPSGAKTEKTPADKQEAVQEAVTRLWNAAQEAGYTNEQIIKLVTDSAPKPKADQTTDKLNAMRGVTDRIVKKTSAAKLGAKVKTAKAS